MDIFYLYIYIILLVGSLLFYIKRKRNFDAGALLLTLYTVYAFFSILLYTDDNLEFRLFELTLFPLIFLYICLILSFTPVLTFNAKKYESILAPSHFRLEVIAWVFVLSYLFQIHYIATHLSHGLVLILLDDEGTKELYSEMTRNASEGNKGISNLPSIIGNLLYGFGVFLFFYFLTLNKLKKTLLIGMSIGIIIGILEYIASGQRGGMITRSLLLIGTFFLFKDFINSSIKKWIRRVGFVFLSIIAVFFIVMSISRFSSKKGGVFSSINRYAGQPVLYFDNYAFDNNGLRYGDRTIPVFKMLLGFDNVPRNYVERRAKYPHLYINDEVFITFVGDFCLDFGPVIAFTIILFFSIWVRHLTICKAKKYPFHKLYILYLSLMICIEGGSLFYQADFGNVGLIFNFLIYLFFYYRFKNQQLLIKARLA